MTRHSDHNEAKQLLETIDSKRDDYLIIHYSCESFYDKVDGRSPRITSIAIRKFDDGQTNLFAIHKIAEIMKVPFNEIDENYDVLEKEMLKKYFEYVAVNSDKTWIHWNMRDSNYGFKAIEHRYEVLGGNPTLISDKNKIDLARLFIKCYGKGYTGHPRIATLTKQNDIKPKDMLGGQTEAEAFENKEFIKLSMSTASKVDLFSNYLTLAVDNKLKVLSKKREIYGTSFKGIYSIIQDSPWLTILFWVVNLIIGAIVGGWVGKKFF